jgi:hypothetical protein
MSKAEIVGYCLLEGLLWKGVRRSTSAHVPAPEKVLLASSGRKAVSNKADPYSGPRPWRAAPNCKIGLEVKPALAVSTNNGIVSTILRVEVGWQAALPMKLELAIFCTPVLLHNISAGDTVSSPSSRETDYTDRTTDRECNL